MEKITIKSLEEYSKLHAKEIAMRLGREYGGNYKHHVLVCGGATCEFSQSDEITKNIKEHVKLNGLEDEILVIKTGCFGFCTLGPIVKVMPDNTFYVHVTPSDAQEIVELHFVKGKKVERILHPEQKENSGIKDNISFYNKQNKIVLKNCGVIDPENMDEYIGNGGYKALSKVVSKMSPSDVIEELKKSGLRGRGGAGFPAWRKWDFTKNAEGDRKYIVCNGDEGDPGAYMDRAILEGDPHAIIEAMIIAGYAVGASKGYFYIRAEYTIAIDRIYLALSQAYEAGLLGKNILGTDFSFDLDIRLGAGAFVCGEETALLASIEGQRGTPRPRPPFPAFKGLFGCPTVINNVETLGSITAIINNGGDWFATIGTEDSKGTKVFALTGSVNVSGLVEVPMGTTIREIVYEIGGGIPENKKVKGIQTGGPSGGIIPESQFDIPIDYKSLIELGSMMGSGGMIVIDETQSMVDFARFYLEFCVDESCGKCAPCRIGGKQLLAILNKFSKKRAKKEDLDKINEIALAMKKASLCALGGTAPNPVLSTIKHFESEYMDGIFVPRTKKRSQEIK